jgi:hypothetical protein
LTQFRRCRRSEYDRDVRQAGGVVVVLALGGCELVFAPSGGGAADDDASIVDSPDLDAPAIDAAIAIDASPPDAMMNDASASCPPGYPATGGYRIVTTDATWEAAVADCADDELGGSPLRTHLVVFDDEAERSFVNAMVPGIPHWIGLSDRVVADDWRWVTLEPIVYYPGPTGGPWDVGEPDGEGDCALMMGTAEFDDRPCNSGTARYICECDVYPDTPSQY